jgi:hypothetical protein
LVPFASLLRPEFAGTGINHASDRSHGSEASYINYEDITSSKTQYTHYTGEDDIDGLHDSSTQGDGIRSSGIGSVATNACIPPTTLPRRDPPVKPYLIALIERGGCDFATKVRAAQDRGCAGVVVGDSRLRDGETDEEGRKRENLITMFSPGEQWCFQGVISWSGRRRLNIGMEVGLCHVDSMAPASIIESS